MPRRKPFAIPACPKQAPLTFDRDQPWLAPLAGYSDLPFRLLCREYGASVCETEMISAKGLLYKSPGTADLLASAPRDAPLVVQLFGGDPGSLAEALFTLRQAGYRYFDCNMGCPVRKVLAQKAGSALMGDPQRALDIAKSMLEAVTRPADAPPALLGFKIRLGLGAGRDTWLDLARNLEDAGAAWIAFHPRYASQGYGGRADWSKLARLAETLQIPVIASGDLLTAASGRECLEQTGCRTIMYARGALHNPHIFTEHGTGLARPDPARMKDIITRHMELTAEYCEERRGFVKIRSLLPRYARFLPGTGEFRKALSSCASWEELKECVDRFFDGVRS